MITKEEQQLLDLIDKDECIKLTRELVQIDSVIRPDKGNTEKKVTDFIEKWLEEKAGISPIREEVEPGRENLIVEIDSGKPGRCLMLEGHTDVVSEGDRSLWKHDPFGGEVEDGKLYGRGSCDMKAGVAVNMLIAKALKESGLDFKGKLKLGIVCDEEGMMIGIKDFIKKGHADDVDAALVSEPEENQLCITMKGAIRAKVSVKGKMAHGAMPLTGINPNPRMARIILGVEAYENEEKERCGEDKLVGYPSMTVTVVQAPPAGEPAQLNVMPGEAMAYIDIRTTPCQDHDEIRARLKKIIDDLSREDENFSASIEFIEDRPVVTMDKDEPIAVCAAKAYTDITGKDPVYNGVPGATDGTFLRAWKNIPSLVNGPGPRHMPHQTDEYVETEELYEAARIYAVTALRYLREES
ncbi:MAG: M20 family metallopeptidase [Spirochaetaceae bacterium]